jgi:8-hydroxy-5-deazaflavin:NADPH oxidoreductase
MNIAIIGAGSVGGNLARGWARRGHAIIFGARDPTSRKLAPLLAETSAKAAPIAEAVRGAEVVVLATPWDGTLELVRATDLRGRIVVDATNPLLPKLAGLATSVGTSGGEEIQRAAIGARVVKCFNTTGANNYLAPTFPDGAATMLLAGDDADAKTVVRNLGEDLGFEMVDAGPLARARLLEPMALLWITLAYSQGMGRDIAFRLMRRKA